MISLEKAEIYKVVEVEALFWCFKVIEKISFILSFISIGFLFYAFLNRMGTSQAVGAIFLFLS
jgi:hypothetical protein